ncbi:hypothetical protein HD806DRAFT_550879 [Xylariaceae sp. AK1471]|nr:hypothetical protein HD806DRAFT_550879 [Xylariaceae sp. AK1471]
MAVDLPDTPPETPGGENDMPAKGDEGVSMGNVNNQGVTNHGGVVTGNVSGFALLIGTVQIVGDSATALSDDIHCFMSRVEMTTQKFRSVADKVGATATVLDTISALVEKQAKREGISLTNSRDVSLPKQDEGKEKNKEGEGGGEPESNVLSMRCFKNIIEASKRADCYFQHITEKIDKALILLQLISQGDDQTRTSPQSPVQQQQKVKRPKVEFSEADRECVFLQERDIEDMDNQVERHKTDLHMQFVVFQFYMNDEEHEKSKKSREITEQIVIGSWRRIREVVDLLRRGGDDPPPNSGGKSLPRPDIHDPLSLQKPRPLPNMRSLHSPDFFGLIPPHTGWIFRKAPPPDDSALGLERSQRPSWIFAVPIRMPFSTEELFVRAHAQIARREQFGRSLLDDYVALLKLTSQRMLVDRLIRAQNDSLQRYYPHLEWALAGLESELSHIATTWTDDRESKKFASKKKEKREREIEVILKTQRKIPGWAQPPHGPVGIAGPASSGRLGPDPTFSGLPSGRSSGIPVSHGIHGGQTKRRGFPPVDKDSGGKNGMSHVPNPKRGRLAYSEPHLPLHPRPRPQRSELPRHRPVVVRNPQFVFVKEWGKEAKTKKHKKAKRKHDEDSGRQRGGMQIYIELRRPEDSPGPTPFPDLPPHPRLHLPQEPQPAVFIGSERSNIPPPPPPPASVPAYIRIASQRTAAEQEKEETEVIEELFEEWHELTDKKGKKKSRRSGLTREVETPGRSHMPPEVDDGDSDSDVGIIRTLMREVERESQYKMMMEKESILRTMAELKMQPRVPPPPPLMHVHEQHPAGGLGHVHVQEWHLASSPPLGRPQVQEFCQEYVQEWY